MGTLTIEAKILGQKRVTPERVLPWPGGPEGERLLLRDLISRIVRQEVGAFQERQAERRLLRVLTPEAVARGVERGKVDSGGSDLDQTVDPEAAVSGALIAFADGLYYVFVDGEQKERLDQEVHLRPDSRVTFVRLVPLAGG